MIVRGSIRYYEPTFCLIFVRAEQCRVAPFSLTGFKIVALVL